jgi:hypothetical protein
MIGQRLLPVGLLGDLRLLKTAKTTTSARVHVLVGRVRTVTDATTGLATKESR